MVEYNRNVNSKLSNKKVNGKYWALDGNFLFYFEGWQLDER